MEPVPETERMEAFKPSPVPSLITPSNSSPPPPLVQLEALRKPPTQRRKTDPSPTSATLHPWTIAAAMPYRPRNTSPLSGGHSRSRSVASLAPPMSRTQSMPGVNGSGHMILPPLVRPQSPMNSSSPNRSRTPRKFSDEAFPPTSPVRTSVLEGDHGQARRSISPSLNLPPLNASRLRRPSSPMRNLPPSGTLPSTPSSVSSSPSYRAPDAFYPVHPGSLSSVPSTPTSTRSRSPSISSLETIPDSPDAEEAAVEADRLAQIKAVAEALENTDQASDTKTKASTDVPARGRSLVYGPSKDKRKRWSVCGAERRGDLDLETIWED